MAQHKRSSHEPIDYLRRKNERKKLGSYLMAGKFKGRGMPGHRWRIVERRRIAFIAAVAVVLSIGAFFTVF